MVMLKLCNICTLGTIVQLKMCDISRSVAQTLAIAREFLVVAEKERQDKIPDLIGWVELVGVVRLVGVLRVSLILCGSFLCSG